jgi:hypothetical protein
MLQLSFYWKHITANAICRDDGLFRKGLILLNLLMLTICHSVIIIIIIYSFNY